MPARLEAVRTTQSRPGGAAFDADATAQSMPGRLAGEMASRAHHLVLRDLHPTRPCAGLRASRRALAVPVRTAISEAEGARHARPERGLLTRPSLAEVFDYRRRVDEALLAALPLIAERCLDLLALGLNSRATASGIAAHRSEASLLPQPTRSSGLACRKRTLDAKCSGRRSSGLRALSACWTSATPTVLSLSTMSAPCIVII